jgi:polyisoprenoid-binding protein YceI
MKVQLLAFRVLKCSAALMALAALMAIATGSPMFVSAQDSANPLREPGVIETPDDTLTQSLAECSDAEALAPGELAEVPDGDTGYVINGAPSEARYVIDEELGGIGANTAIGRTNAFIGQIVVDAEGVPVDCSRFDVDMRTLESDQAKRDNFLRGNTLQSDQFPVATFVLLEVEGLDGPLTADDQTFSLIGDLTFRGDTKLVVWEATAKVDGGNLVGTAFTEFELADFNIQKPIVGSVISIADTVRLEVDIDAAKA